MSTNFLIIHVGTDHTETPIGEVQIDDAGMLTLLSAIPAQAMYLQDWVQRLNERQDFILKVPPPTDSTAPMLASHGRRFSRLQPSFLSDLRAYVRQSHGIKLLTPAELAAASDGLKL